MSVTTFIRRTTQRVRRARRRYTRNPSLPASMTSGWTPHGNGCGPNTSSCCVRCWIVRSPRKTQSQSSNMPKALRATTRRAKRRSPKPFERCAISASRIARGASSNASKRICAARSTPIQFRSSRASRPGCRSNRPHFSNAVANYAPLQARSNEHASSRSSVHPASEKVAWRGGPPRSSRARFRAARVIWISRPTATNLPHGRRSRRCCVRERLPRAPSQKQSRCPRRFCCSTMPMG